MTCIGSRSRKSGAKCGGGGGRVSRRVWDVFSLLLVFFVVVVFQLYWDIIDK